MKARIYRDDIKPEDLKCHVSGWLEITIEDRPATNIEVVHNEDGNNAPVKVEVTELPDACDFVYEGRVRQVSLSHKGRDVIISRDMLTKLVGGVSGVTFTEAEAFVDRLVSYT